MVFVDQGFAALAGGEHGGGQHIIPFLTGHAVHNLLLGTLLATL